MSQAITVTNLAYSAADLRRLMSKQKDGAVVRRLMALALILEGKSRTEAAQQSGMERQTLRDWVHRYNAHGIAGLKSRRNPGRKPALTTLQRAELLDLVLAGPDPQVHGVVRWRCVDLRDEVARRFSVKVHEATIARWLHELELTRLQPRPYHPKKDGQAETAFKKTSPLWSKPRSPKPQPTVR